MQHTHSAQVMVAAFPVTPEVVGNAVAVSQAVPNEGLFITTSVSDFQLPFTETPLGKDVLTRDNPFLSPAALNTLDARGIVKLGTQVRFGDALVSKLRPKSVWELPEQERLMHVIFGKPEEKLWKNDTLEYTNLDPGEVVSVEFKAKNRGSCPRCGDVQASEEKCPHCGERLENQQIDDLPDAILMEVTVGVMIRRNLSPGDVLEDDRGTKVVVAAILTDPKGAEPQSGSRVAMWIHPDSQLAPRLQGQEILHHQNCRAELLELKKITTRLEDKVRARATGPYSLITVMPLGNFCPGQWVREDTARALFQAGYRQNLMEMLTIKSDAVEGRRLAYEATLKGKPIPNGIPDTTYRLASYLKALCIDLRLTNRQGDVVQPVNLDEGANRHQELLLAFAGANAADIRSWSFGEVKKAETLNYRTYRPEPDGLFCERIFGPERDWECACRKFRGIRHKGTICDRCGVKITHSQVRRRRLGHIDLAAPVVHSWFLKAGAGLAHRLGMSQQNLQNVVYCRDFVVTDPGGTDLARKQVLNPAEHNAAIEKYGSESFKAAMGGDAIRQLLHKESPALDWIVLDALPVSPPDLRPLVLLDNGNFATSDLNDLYLRIINRNNRLRKLVQLNAPSAIICNEKRVLQEFVDSLFDNGSLPNPVLGSKNKPLMSLSDQLVQTFQHLGEKRTDYSARAVVIPDSTLDVGTDIGLPTDVVQILFKLWAIPLVQSLGKANSVKAAAKWLEQEGQSPESQDIYRQVLAGHPVLVITDTQQFVRLQPKMVEGEAFRLHPDDAKKLGITFSGQQITIHVPLSTTAIEELSNPRPDSDAVSMLGALNPNLLVAHLASRNDPHRLDPFDRVLLGIDRGSAPAVQIS